MRHNPPRYQQGPGLRSRLVGEGVVLKKLRRMDRTKKEVTTLIDRNVSDIEGGKGGANGRGERRQKR